MTASPRALLAEPMPSPPRVPAHPPRLPGPAPRCPTLARRRAWAIVVAGVIAAGCRGPEAPSSPLPSPIPDRAPRDAAPPPDPPLLDAGGSDAGLATATAPCPPDDTTAIEGSTARRDTLTLTKVRFAELPSWADDKLGEAVPAFLRSCDKLRALADDAPVGADGHGGRARHWRRPCAAASKLAAGDHAAARAMFEAEFVPYAAAGTAGPTGKLTGYYVAELRASRTRHGKFQTPVLARPDDLVMVDLSAFITDAHARRIWGRMDHGHLVPYYTRAQIRRGVLARRGLELMYADDPVDVLFAQIEGSGKAKLDDGTTAWLEFAGKNGRAYRGVGGVLRRGGLLEPGQGTMQGIRAWFHANPTRYDEIADQDASYVFFSISKQPGAVGSQMTILTARRSIAVDRSLIALSTPIWVETHVPVPGKPGVTGPWRQLLIAQDTGAGIVGAVRGDIYWGDDADAAELGGRMGGPGRYWLLLPRGVTR
jgi:membrane-bound lytic murein transglycosylase A